MNPALSSIPLENLKTIAEAQRAMLIVLTSVTVPEAAKELHERAIQLTATTLENLFAHHNQFSESPLDLDHVDQAFARKVPNV